MKKSKLLNQILRMGKTEGRRIRGQKDRKWDGWMASPAGWTWVWANSRSWWWTRKPDMLQSMGSLRAGHDWVTELSWTEPSMYYATFCAQRLGDYKYIFIFAWRNTGKIPWKLKLVNCVSTTGQEKQNKGTGMGGGFNCINTFWTTWNHQYLKFVSICDTG